MLQKIKKLKVLKKILIKAKHYKVKYAIFYFIFVLFSFIINKKKRRDYINKLFNISINILKPINQL